MMQWLAFSVDLEPNKDGSIEGVAESMEWFDETVPHGTVYTTHDIATQLPDLISMLAERHEIGVHVHPREFGHEHDQLAALGLARQKELISRSRSAVATAASLDETDVTAFRAGRHSANLDTLTVLSDLGFTVDASVHVRYDQHLPTSLVANSQPFETESGLTEIPTTFARPRLCTRAGIRAFPNRRLTATGNTLRTDRRACSGLHAVEWLFNAADAGVSMYMHPYDATTYHDSLENCGGEFRERVETLLSAVGQDRFASASELAPLAK